MQEVKLNLYHGEILIGTITKLTTDFPWDEDGDIWWRMWPLGTSERVKKELESK